MAEGLTVMAVGDIFFGLQEYPPRPGLVPVSKDRTGLYTWFDKVSPVLHLGDFTLGNLEGQICEPLPDLEGKAIWGNIIRMPPEAADILKSTGFNALSIANNHTMDLGAEGLFQTLDNLDRVGIAHSGGGRNIQEARKPAILERKGVRLALLSYSSVFVPGTFPAGRDKPGIATVAVKTSYEIPDRLSYSPGLQPRIITTPSQKDVQQMTEDVRQAKTQADVVVVSCHWGFTKHANSGASGIPVEDSPLFVLNYQEDVGHAAIDAGADLIFGHHTFWLQGMEVYKGKLICYSLGRLSAPYKYVDPVLGDNSVILKGYIDPDSKQLARITLIPVRIAVESQEPFTVSACEGLDIIRELERQSKKYGTKFQQEGEEFAIQRMHHEASRK